MADLDEENGICIRYRTNGSLFNLRRLKAHTKTLNHLVRELRFADNATLVAHTEAALQCLTFCFAEAAELFGLEVSLKKTEVLYQPALQEVFHHPHITTGRSSSIGAMLMRMQLRWAGHVSRMEDHLLMLCGELATGCCKRGAPKRR